MSSKEIAPAAQAKIQDLSDFVKTLQDDVTSASPCKLCNSKYKKEAHEIYEARGTCTAVTKFLREKGEDISNTAVTSHINNHYKAASDNNNLRELASKLSKWSQLSMDDEALYTRYIKLLDMEATYLMTQNPLLDLMERRKNTELCLKIAQTIGYYKDQLKELQLEKRPVEIFVDTLNRIIQVKLRDASSPEVKRVLADVVEQLHREVESVPDNLVAG
jgi:hypothetical protein